ncbi:MAG: hypothetical protein DMD26_03285 [Gemmatimonadetes bacterium]|nr:MAG: hypothetical protein DMD26_03285 [Gemmatimonadota bacterium]
MTLVSSRRSRVVIRAAAVLAAAVHPLALVAQDPDPLSRLDPNTRFVVEVIIDSARVAGVPTRPLLLKALQGAAYHADNKHIIAAVRSVFHAELDVRVALGSALNESEWASAVSALQSGVPLEALAKFRGERSGKPLTRALVVLTDLIQRGVPVSEASSAIMQLWQRGAGDGDFYGLWKNVEQDILSGQNPGTALEQRMREIPVRVTPGTKIPPASQEPNNSSS